MQLWNDILHIQNSMDKIGTYSVKMNIRYLNRQKQEKLREKLKVIQIRLSYYIKDIVSMINTGI